MKVEVSPASHFVVPAKAGTSTGRGRDSCLHRNDGAFDDTPYFIGRSETSNENVSVAPDG